MHTKSVLTFLKTLQNQIYAALEQGDSEAEFVHEAWTEKLGIGGARVLKSDVVFEQTGVNSSHVKDSKMPASTTMHHPRLAGTAFEAMGVPLVVYSENPYIPTDHADVRFFIVYPENAEPIWWFDGDFDSMSLYPFEEDIVHWHTVAQDIRASSGKPIYPEFKQWCDEYLYLKYRGGTRGMGGLFFDDLSRWDFDTCLDFIEAVGEGHIVAYLPIAMKRRNTSYGRHEHDLQLYRYGRYVKFSLVQDRGTLFGLQSNGHTESILTSMPSLVRFKYQYALEEDSPEARLNQFLIPRNWLKEAGRQFYL